MKKTYQYLFLLSIGLFAFQSCEDMDDTVHVSSGLEVESFIYRGLNLYYLWKDDVPDLADDRFASTEEKDAFLDTAASPEALFQDLLYKPVSKFPTDPIDRFSVMVSDYTVLENLFAGVTKNNGVDYGLKRKTGTNEAFGWVRYIIPGSDAAAKDIRRGDIFYAVNGVPLFYNSQTDNNLALLNAENYTLSLADYNGGAITPNGRSVSLTKTELTENPVYDARVIAAGTHKIAYLSYNGFTANFDEQLNTAFGQFKAQGATDLVLDLRYNSGGSVRTATRLASMITGQFNGQLFAKQQWNAQVQAAYEDQNPQALVNNFTNSIGSAGINSLNLSKVYILTTIGTASASELVINGLKPYIEVVQIGDKTTGKNVGSITLYDSPALVNKDNISTKHKYAMQPLVFKTTNADGFGDYGAGLAPNVPLMEDLNNLGQLGDVNEPLLSTAIGLITASGRMIHQNPENANRDLKDSKSMRRFGTDMYLENIPTGIIRK
ncbi:MAG: peptidase S41 [Flavobacterium sp. BFFFF1]|uniref:S41 family peptidase n=1 Tax=Flavobacterium sp. BFFFF1 TaxID=2015557 RepID=UPI000BC387B5|nr:S41 family peptidase [Flavobacterium sp. BFFFF1]OYU80567.1 MAG: peptidase S41 [Flavobacterium sp. BFFFF1]